jgi:RNA polymerase sigma-70 factor, ECF subfamily
MAAPDEAAATFEPHRRRLTGLAYRMLGSLSEAEDIVQDAYLRWHAAERGRVDNPRAYLRWSLAARADRRRDGARPRHRQRIGG